jgi:2'-5' RNA ligase
MIRLPQTLSNEIRVYAASIPQALRKRTEDMPGGIPDEVHITVKYGILTEDAEDVANVLAGNDPIRIKLGNASVFHNEEAAVLKLGVDSIGLRKLYNRICKNIAHVNTYRDFHPHVTVAYMVKKDEDPYYYRTFFDDSYAGREFEVEEALFSAANGSQSIISFNGTVKPVFVGRAARIASRLVN